MRVSLRLYKLSTDHLLRESDRITGWQLSAGTFLSVIAAIMPCLHWDIVRIRIHQRVGADGHQKASKTQGRGAFNVK